MSGLTANGETMTRTEQAHRRWENDFVLRPNVGDASASVKLSRRAQLTGLMFAFLLAFAGCGGSSEESDRDTTSSGKASEPVAPAPQPLVIKATPLQGQGSGNATSNEGQEINEGDGGSSGQSPESGSAVPLPP